MVFGLWTPSWRHRILRGRWSRAWCRTPPDGVLTLVVMAGWGEWLRSRVATIRTKMTTGGFKVWQHHFRRICTILHSCHPVASFVWNTPSSSGLRATVQSVCILYHIFLCAFFKIWQGQERKISPFWRVALTHFRTTVFIFGWAWAK